MSYRIIYKDKTVGQLLRKSIVFQSGLASCHEYTIACISKRNLNDELIGYLKASGVHYIMNERGFTPLCANLPIKMENILPGEQG